MPLPCIKIEVIPHGSQRYPTVGDYWYQYAQKLQVRISDLGDPDYEFLVLIHELVESHLCQKRGIPEQSIKEFDMKYEEERDPEDKITEPGDSPRAPYRREHQFATKIERIVAQELGVDWAEYSKVVNAL